MRRIAAYARPYRGSLALFLIATALSAVITVAVPLLLKTIIDQGILAENTGGGHRRWPPWSPGWPWSTRCWPSCSGGYSARIGEGLIYDLRTQVFGHVQRQPIAFFTRAQTGSLVSRLNSDVIGAQQAITSTLSVGGVQRADR